MNRTTYAAAIGAAVAFLAWLVTTNVRLDHLEKNKCTCKDVSHQVRGNLPLGDFGPAIKNGECLQLQVTQDKDGYHMNSVKCEAKP